MKTRMQFAFLAFCLLATFSCTKESAAPVDIPRAENVTAVEGALLDLVNEHRVALGYNALTFSSVAYKYANEHTEYMIATATLSHGDFSARATQISEAVNARAIAENVARDYAGAREALQGWLDSESHRKTMEGVFSHTAVSVKKAPDGSLYFTQLFYLE